jgi:hypothetical protein
MMERASLVEVKEHAACDYELYVETPETCNPPPKCGTDGGLLAGATAQGSLSIRDYPRDFTVKFNEVNGTAHLIAQGRPCGVARTRLFPAHCGAGGVCAPALIYNCFATHN